MSAHDMNWRQVLCPQSDIASGCFIRRPDSRHRQCAALDDGIVRVGGSLTDFEYTRKERQPLAYRQYSEIRAHFLDARRCVFRATQAAIKATCRKPTPKRDSDRTRSSPGVRALVRGEMMVLVPNNAMAVVVCEPVVLFARLGVVVFA